MSKKLNHDTNQYKVDFTFYVGIDENADEKLLNLTNSLDNIKEIDDYGVEEDDEEYCVNTVAIVSAHSISQVTNVMNNILADINYTWDYHYIKGITSNEYWEP